jgi:MoxR-like ATPase
MSTSPSPPPAKAAGTDVAALAMRIISNVEKVILGKRQQVVLIVVATLSEGHVLLEDVPGVAKTMLGRALARSIGSSFKRVQCTPDLLPTDVTGASIFNQKVNEFEFRPGPIFAQIVLADEINRATPRTQSALLEAMGEGNVTVDGVTHNLERPFQVIATQNPIDHEGTFPLPEAQLDRFLMRLSLGYPTQEEEAKMLANQQRAHPIESLEPVASVQELLHAQKVIREVFIDDKVRTYLLQVVARTRNHDDVRLGGSPRASLALYRASQALAAVRNRKYVLPDDIKRLAVPILGHRLILKPESRLRKVTPTAVVEAILNEVPVPVPTAEGQGQFV